ncbi:MAG: carbohydrate ABC transporter permease [Lachnospiraceae bacterium]|jgi:putative aldouronate transport system permease protein|nr:carbohydrate ABC transporter permease [Lachnospiraceae bacterium]
MKSKDDLKWQVISNTVLALFSLAALLPFILLVVASFTDENWALANGYSFFPGKWSTQAYSYILQNFSMVGRGYLNTLLVTGIGTFGSILLTSLFAYALANDKLPGVRILNFLCIFTMLFTGGQVASYYVWSNVFHVRDTYMALILPNLMMNAFNVILVKNYYKTSIPASLLEAAKVDGASEFGIFLKIVLPLSIPINATIGLMTGLAYWNDWVNGLYFLTARKGAGLFTIQLILNQISDSISFLQNASGSATAGIKFPAATARMSIAVAGIIPVLIIYPFLQKYFVKGITVGAVKE